MKLEKSLGLEITKHDKTKIKDRKPMYEFKLGGVKYSASTDSSFKKEFMQALLKHQHEKVEYPRLDEKIFGRKFIYQTYLIIRLHNHPFWEDD